MEEKYQITIGKNPYNVFIGEVVYEGKVENSLRKKVDGITLRGHWENNTQEMTITFTSPICKWERLDTVSV